VFKDFFRHKKAPSQYFFMLILQIVKIIAKILNFPLLKAFHLCYNMLRQQ